MFEMRQQLKLQYRYASLVPLYKTDFQGDTISTGDGAKSIRLETTFRIVQ